MNTKTFNCQSFTYCIIKSNDIERAKVVLRMYFKLSMSNLYKNILNFSPLYTGTTGNNKMNQKEQYFIDNVCT
jgi:hypothetical protein